MIGLINNKYIDIHTHRKANSEDQFTIHNIFAIDFNPNELISKNYYSVGLHPWHIEEGKIDMQLQNVLLAAQNKNVLAIGEIGLDRTIDVSIELQTKIFIEQIKIAEQVNKPIIVHCVKTYSDIIALNKRLKIKVPLIFHGYNGNEQIMKQLVLQKCYVSFGSWLMNQKSKAFETFLFGSPEFTFFETDESEYPLEDIYLRAAVLRNINLTELLKQTEANFKRCFQWK